MRGIIPGQPETWRSSSHDKRSLTVSQVCDLHGADAVELRHALDLREGNDSVVCKSVIARAEHHSRILLPFIHIDGFQFLEECTDKKEVAWLVLPLRCFAQSLFQASPHPSPRLQTPPQSHRTTD